MAAPNILFFSLGLVNLRTSSEVSCNIPLVEVNRCTVSPKLENNIKLMRKVELPKTPEQVERFVKHCCDVIYFPKITIPIKFLVADLIIME